MCVAFRIGICSVLAISRLSAHASFDLHLLLNSVRGFGGGGWGGGGGDDVHATATCVSFSFGDLLLLRCGAVCRTRFVVLSGCLLLDFPNVYHAKPRVFAAFQTQTSQLTPKLHNHKTRKAWYLRHFRQNATKNKNKKHGKTKTPKRRLVHENLAKHRFSCFY